MASGILNSSLRQCCDINPFVTVSSLGDGCVTHFAGTSSAAPIAAAILALVLETNPDLTWRDVQHLIAMTAKVPDPKEPGWSVNGAGILPSGGEVSVNIQSAGCLGINTEVNTLEHVQKALVRASLQV
ncbi:endoprotease bli isoform X3 [Salmo trutta]|uniref:endoprotease bli isoform X3 n=1 Tax=Salmo trutta TaxID=8032 RepID=UPI001131E7BD|nr:endoprotease bli-like isoform X3 [Salmo trutta]XP_029590994.1 endoprotease bli-like isoform X3 [Salmo trutta]